MPRLRAGANRVRARRIIGAMPELAGAEVRPLTTADVMTMVEAGIIDPDERIELEEGVIIRMNPIGPHHRGAVRWLNERFAAASVGRPWEVSVQDQIDFPSGFRSPDLLVTRRLRRDEGAETGLLIVEIADSSARRDREKALLYAQIGVDEYWIADLGADLVLVHRGPGPDGYADVRAAQRGEVLRPVAVPDAPEIDVAGLLG